MTDLINEYLPQISVVAMIIAEDSDYSKEDAIELICCTIMSNRASKIKTKMLKLLNTLKDDSLVQNVIQQLEEKAKQPTYTINSENIKFDLKRSKA